MLEPSILFLKWFGDSRFTIQGELKCWPLLTCIVEIEARDDCLIVGCFCQSSNLDGAHSPDPCCPAIRALAIVTPEPRFGQRKAHRSNGGAMTRLTSCLMRGIITHSTK
jgi:hypothetical protein